MNHFEAQKLHNTQRKRDARHADLRSMVRHVIDSIPEIENDLHPDDLTELKRLSNWRPRPKQ